MNKIVALTTDPYKNIHGYALVFLRLMNYLDENYDHDVVLYSNNGACSDVVQNENFLQLVMDPSSPRLVKLISLITFFISKAWSSPRGVVILVNCEIPELLAAWIVKLKHRDNVYCVVQDLRVRRRDFFTRLLGTLRVFLICRIGNVLFANKYTMVNFSRKVNKFYLGNPVF